MFARSSARVLARRAAWTTATAGLACLVHERALQMDDQTLIIADALGAKQQAAAGLEYSQHAQVQMFWENPGVYLFGSNRGRVANPASSESYTKQPVRLTELDGLALRDLKVGEDMGVAVLDNGDVVQWGDKYWGEKRETGDRLTDVTLKGKNITKVELSSDTVFALAQSGEVYALPYGRQDQLEGPKTQEPAWFGLSTSPSTISYRRVRGKDTFTDIATGKDHLVLLSGQGQVFTAATTVRGNSRGQMGLHGHTAQDVDACDIEAHLVLGFKNAPAVSIAAGEHHSVVLDSDGEVFTFGANGHGQLGFEFQAESQDVSTPTSVAVSQLYARNFAVRCRSIAAGGKNTFMVIEATEYGRTDSTKVDIWACGTGLQGQLGNNTWNHHQSRPVKVRSISGLREWDEVNHRPIPIGVHSLSVGNTHVVAVLDNVAYVGAETDDFHDVNWGRDVFLWGGNADYQMGTGKRNNRATPEYIQPMESRAETMAVRSGWQPESGDHKRFQLTPAKVITVKTADGHSKKMNVEQAVVAGDKVTACYARLVPKS